MNKTVKFCVPKQKVYNVVFVSLRTVFVTDVLQKHGPPGPLLSKNWGIQTPHSLWMRLSWLFETLGHTLRVMSV